MVRLCCFLFLLLGIVVTVIVCTTASDEKNDIPQPDNSCVSSQDEWRCCAATPSVKNYSLTVCVDLKLLREDLGMKMDVTFNNYTVFDEEISARNPPALCDDVPYLEEVVQVCLRFYDMNIDKEKKEISGCLRFEGKLIHHSFAKIKIGCFKFPYKWGMKKTGMEKLIQKFNPYEVKMIQ